MEAALRVLAPRVLGGLSFEIHPHRSKQDLIRKLPQRLKGYASWMPSTWRLVVVVDQDDDDCEELKKKLEEIAKNAGFTTRTANATEYAIVNRIAIEELEAWFFGDWEAVRAAYSGLGAAVPQKAAYRDPDAVKGGTWEAFERELQVAGHFTTGLRKIEVASAVAAHMDPDRNKSRSFQVFRDALREMAGLVGA